jgi:hypothetical protein
MFILNDFKTFAILVITGQIPDHKKKEFEQTYRLASSTIGKDCLFHNLTMDLSRSGHYQLFTIWSNDDDLKEFTESVEYQMMNGAFHALGSIGQSFTGSLSNLKEFSMNNYLSN